MSGHGGPGSGRGLLAVPALIVLALGAAVPAASEGFRSITTVTGDYYFPGSSPASYFIESEQVLLVQVVPALTIEAKVTRDDYPIDQQHQDQHIFFLGPVISFAPTIYAVALYGLGPDSLGNVIQEADASFNWETDTSAAFVTVKWNYFSASGGSWYLLPSIGGKLHLLPALGLFGEFFMSLDESFSPSSGAFWGELDYALNPVVSLLGGFTVSIAPSGAASANSTWGFSVIAGVVVNITENIALKYKGSFLSNVVQYRDGSQPTTNYGVENLLSLDWKF